MLKKPDRDNVLRLYVSLVQQNLANVQSDLYKELSALEFGKCITGNLQQADRNAAVLVTIELQEPADPALQPDVHRALRRIKRSHNSKFKVEEGTAALGAVYFDDLQGVVAW